MKRHVPPLLIGHGPSRRSVIRQAAHSDRTPANPFRRCQTADDGDDGYSKLMSTHKWQQQIKTTTTIAATSEKVVPLMVTSKLSMGSIRNSFSSNASHHVPRRTK